MANETFNVSDYISEKRKSKQKKQDVATKKTSGGTFSVDEYISEKRAKNPINAAVKQRSQQMMDDYKAAWADLVSKTNERNAKKSKLESAASALQGSAYQSPSVKNKAEQNALNKSYNSAKTDFDKITEELNKIKSDFNSKTSSYYNDITALASLDKNRGAATNKNIVSTISKSNWFNDGYNEADKNKFLREETGLLNPFSDLPSAVQSLAYGKAGQSFEYIPEEERRTFEYIAQTQGADAAQAYYERYIQPNAYMRRAQNIVEAEAEKAEERSIGGNIGMNLVRNPAKLGSTLYALIGKAKGESNDYVSIYNPAYDVNAKTSVTKEVNSQKIMSQTRVQDMMLKLFGDADAESMQKAQKADEMVNKIENFLIGTGESVAENAMYMGVSYLLAPVTGGASVAVLPEVLIAGSVWSDTYYDLKQRGVDEDKAMTVSTIAAIAESFFEKFSLDKVIKTIDNPQAMKEIVKNLFTQAGVEGSEEMFTEVTNIVTEVAILKEDSEYAQLVEQYISEGETEESAKNKATVDMLLRIGEAGLGGALAGGVMGGGASVVSEIRNSYNERKANEVNNADTGTVDSETKTENDITAPESAENAAIRQAAEKAYQNEVAKQNAAAELEASRKSVSAPSLQMNEETQAELEETSKKYEERTAQAFKSSYEGQVPVGTYAEAFNSMYRQGKANYSYEEAAKNSLYGQTYLTENERKAAYQAGLAEYNALQQRKEAKSRGEYKTVGLVDRRTNIGENKEQEQGLKLLDSLGSLIQRRIIVEDSIDYTDENGTVRKSAGNAYFDRATNEYHIAADAVDGAYLFIAAHESGHDIEKNNAEGYAALKKVAFEVLESNGQSIDSLVKEYNEKINKNLSREATEVEIVNNTLAALFRDAKMREKFVQKMTGESKKTQSAFKEFITKARKILQDSYNKLKKRASWKQLEAIEKDIKGLDRLMDAYVEALKGRKDVESAENIQSNSKKDFSLKDSEYLSLAEKYENGEITDEETAQLERMVAEAAKEAGYNIEDVSHGTVSFFNIFERSYGNPEGDWGKGFYFTNNRDDVEENYANENGADLTQKIERLAEQLEWQDEYSDMDYDKRLEIAKKQLIKGEPRVINAFLKMENPVVIGNGEQNETFLDFDEGYNQETEEYDDEPSGTLYDFIVNLEEIAYEYEQKIDTTKIYDYAFDGGIYASQLEKLAKEAVMYAEDEYGNLAGHEIVREAFERTGFDGIIDNTVAQKFGTRSGRRNAMLGVDENTTHYIVFSSEQAKQSDPVTYDDNGNIIPLSERFNTENKDIRFSLKENVTDVNGKTYEKVVVLEYGVFNRISRNSRSFVDFIRDNLAGQKITVYNDDGTSETVEFARTNDRVVKGGSKNSHPVLGELEYAKGNLKRLVIANIDETAKISRFSEQNNENTHQWLDKNGWEKRTSYVMTKNGLIYPIDLHIARARDGRNILYSVNTDIKNGVPVDKGAGRLIEETLNKRGGQSQNTAFIVDENGDFVNKVFSLKEVTPENAEQLDISTEEYNDVVNTLNDIYENYKGYYVPDSTIDKLSKKILKDYRSDYSIDTLKENLRTLFDYLANAPQKAWNEVMDMGVGMAKQIINASRSIDAEYEKEVKPIRDYFKKSKIYLNDAQREEAKSAYDSYGNYRKSLFGVVNLRKSGEGVSLDVAWQELSEQFPQFFEANISDTEMVYRLAEAVDLIRPQYVNEYKENNDEAAYDLFLTLHNDFLNLTEDGAINGNNKAAKDEIKKLRDKYEKKIARLRQQYTEKYGARLKKLTDEQKARVKEVQNRYKEVKRQISALSKNGQSSKNNEQIKALYAEKKALNKEYESLKNVTARKLMEQKARFEITTENKRERKSKTNLRDKIYKHANNLATWLKNPTESKHVPEAIRNQVYSFLEQIDFEGNKPTKRSEDWGKKILQLSELMRRASVAETKENYIMNVSDTTIQDIANLAEATKNMRNVRELSEEQLKVLYKSLLELEKAVRDVNKVIVNGKKTDFKEMGEAIIRRAQDDGELKHTKFENSPFGKMFKELAVKPVSFFNRIGGVLEKLHNDILKGENEYGLNVEKAKARIKEIKQKYHYGEWANKKNDALAFTTEKGARVTLTREQALSVYATAKREESNKDLTNAKHLSVGGFVYENNRVEVKDKKFGKGEKEYAFRDVDRKVITDADLSVINKWLTTEQKNYADAMVEYLSSDIAKLGNDVTMQLYGVKSFTEPNYFPYAVSSNYKRTGSTTAGKDVMRLLHKGFTKQTVANANDPIVLQDFSTVCANHIEEMLMYNAMAIPQDAMYKVLNYQQSNKDSYGVSVRAALEKAYGKTATRYIDTYLLDLSGGLTVDPRENFVSKWISKFKKGAVMASLSVVVQQPTSIIRAMALINPKYFATKPRKGAYAEALKYSGIAVIKRVGGFDTSVGAGISEYILGETDMKGSKLREKFKAFNSKDSTYRDKILGWGAAKADELAWAHLWEACKNETEAKIVNQERANGVKNPKVDRNSEEFLQEVGERFNEVIRYTQVYDSVTSRAEIMRSKGNMAKMATAFMAEPLTTLNMFVDAVRNKGKNTSIKTSIPTVTAALVGSIMLNSLVKSLVYAMRDKDDDKSFIEKYLENVTSNFLDDLNPLNYIPYARDIVSIFEGYDAERADLSLVNDLYKACKTIVNEDKTSWEKIEEFSGALANMFGIPLKNAERDVRAVFNVTVNAFASDGDEVFGRDLLNALKRGAGDSSMGKILKQFKLVTGMTSYDWKYSELVEAYTDGDRAYADNLYNELLDSMKDKKRESGNYADDASIDAAAKDSLDTYIGKALMTDERIKEAYEYRLDANTPRLKEVYRRLQNDGFTFNTITKAVNYYAESVSGEKASGNWTNEYEQMSLYTNDDLFREISDGDKNAAQNIYEELLRTKSETSMKSTITREFKDKIVAAYKSGNTAEYERLQQTLEALPLYNSGGYKYYSQWMIDKWIEDSEKGN